MVRKTRFQERKFCTLTQRRTTFLGIERLEYEAAHRIDLARSLRMLEVLTRPRVKKVRDFLFRNKVNLIYNFE